MTYPHVLLCGALFSVQVRHTPKEQPKSALLNLLRAYIQPNIHTHLRAQHKRRYHARDAPILAK